MKRGVLVWGLGCAALMLAACGVPTAALDQARLEAGLLTTMPAADGDVKAALTAQAQQWQTFAALAGKREWGGIWPVSDDFTWLAQQTAAIAQREADLIAQGQDDAALDRAMLEEFAARWAQMQKYLEEPGQ